MAGPKRMGLIQSAKAAAEQVAARAETPQEPPAAPTAPAAPRRNRSLTDESVTTAVHIPREQLALLRRVAVERANRDGGRPSVSDVLRDLIEQKRADLELEARH